MSEDPANLLGDLLVNPIPLHTLNRLLIEVEKAGPNQPETEEKA